MKGFYGKHRDIIVFVQINARSLCSPGVRPWLGTQAADDAGHNLE